MNIAFSTAGYPSWDMRTVIGKAVEHGFDGVELRSLPEQFHMPLAKELEGNPDEVVAMAREANVRILCLATHASFAERDVHLLEAAKTHVLQQLALARKLDCPFVRVTAGCIPDLLLRALGKERRDTTMLRITSALRELGTAAAEQGVTLLVENDGDFCESADLWQLVECADSPAVRCVWNPIAAYSSGEGASTAIPRLASRLKLTRITDAHFDEFGKMSSYAALGEGELDVHHTVQLLKGVGYRGAIVFDHPAVWKAEEAADAVLAAAAAKLRALIREEPVPLTAYKGDKFPPRQGYDLMETTPSDKQGEHAVGG